jgi:hypothetical protein
VLDLPTGVFLEARATAAIQSGRVAAAAVAAWEVAVSAVAACEAEVVVSAVVEAAEADAGGNVAPKLFIHE